MIIRSRNSGEVIFKLVLFSLLNSNKASLRVMEGFLSAASFQSFAGTPIVHSKYNALGDRIGTIRAAYFEKLFERIATL